MPGFLMSASSQAARVSNIASNTIIRTGSHAQAINARDAFNANANFDRLICPIYNCGYNCAHNCECNRKLSLELSPRLCPKLYIGVSISLSP